MVTSLVTPRIASWAATALLAAAVADGPALGQGGCTSACVPLMDLTPPATYLGFEGGLYPGGSNSPPPAHAAAAQRAAEAVVPRDLGGAPHPDGHVGVLSIGVSNQLVEWRAVTRRVDHDPSFAGEVVFVNGAAGAAFSTPLANPASHLWPEIDARIAAAGLTAPQVQVVFLETASLYTPPRPFPQHALDLRDELRAIVQLAKDRFPNLRLVYLSSVTYTGYSTFGVSEPRTYEQGFSVRWLIEEQILGDPRLGHDPLVGPVEAPVLLWGPYLWAFGDAPRSDGFSTPRAYFGPDGVHASRLGEERIADEYMELLTTAPSAQTWLRVRPGRSRRALPVTADATLDDLQPGLALGGAQELQVKDGALRSLLRVDLPPGLGILSHAKLCLEMSERSLNVFAVGVSSNAWDEATVTAATAPAFDGAATSAIPLSSEGGLAEWHVLEQVRAATTAVSLGLVGQAIPLVSAFLSRESVSPGWLTLLVDDVAGGAVVHCPGHPNSTGVPAVLTFTGSTSLSAADLDLHVADAPPLAAMFPFSSSSAAEVPLAGGILCVGGGFTRHPPIAASASGRATFRPQWTPLPGDSRTIQLVFRDIAPGGFRTTSAVTCLFRP